MTQQDFAEVLTDLRNGTAHHELSKAIRQVTEAVQKTGKVGSLTLNIKVKPQGEGQVEIIDEIKTKIPEPAKPSTFMFVDDQNNLTRDNPRQATVFDMKIVDRRTGEIKEVGNNG